MTFTQHDGDITEKTTVSHELEFDSMSAMNRAISEYRGNFFEPDGDKLKVNEEAPLNFWRAARVTVVNYEEFPEVELSDEQKALFLDDPVLREHAVTAATRAADALTAKVQAELLPLARSATSSAASSTKTPR